jgi:hypothetical protein
MNTFFAMQSVTPMVEPTACCWGGQSGRLACLPPGCNWESGVGSIENQWNSEAPAELTMQWFGRSLTLPSEQ